ncbi:uncharacterized protein YhhL (DUF1145 family) [Ralstonia sp. 151470066-2]|jgi:hypothetical protein
MPTETSPHWPAHLPRHLTLPATNLYFNAEVSAARYPDKPFIVFYDTPITFAEFKDETERIAGYLQQRCGVKAGDRVLLYMQNSPQWMLAYYGILRANAVVVPVNPMNMTDELRHYVEDSGARTAFVAQNLYERIAPLMGDADGQLAHTIVATYSDYLKQPSSITPPAFVSAPRHIDGGDRIGVTHWSDVLDARVAPGPLTVFTLPSKLLLLVVYGTAVCSYLTALPVSPDIIHGVRIVAAVLLGVHVLEVLICFRQVALHKGPLFDSVLLTLLFGVLHWKPMDDAAR